MSNPRGGDTAVKILLDGEVEDAIVDITTSDFDPALEERIDEYINSSAPKVSGVNGAPSITITFNPNSTGAAKLVLLQQQKNKPIDSDDEAAVREKTIDVSREIRYPGGSRVRILLPDCTISGATQSAAGRTDKISWTMTFRADKWIPLRLGG